MKHSSSVENMLESEIDPAFALRARLIADTIADTKPKKVLDVGCGRGFYVKMLSLFDSIKEIYGIDVNETYLKKAKKNIGNDKRVVLKKASVYDLPFEDNSFDLIVCSEVLEHLDDDKKAVKELYRVLKKGGTLAVTVPNKNFPFLWDPVNWILMKFFNTHINKNIWWAAGIWADHERLYTKQEIQKLLNSKFLPAGRQAKLILHHCWPFSHFLLYGIGKNIVERMGVSTFDRFDFKKQSSITVLLASLMRLPDKLPNRLKTTSSVNFFVIAKK